MRLDECGTQLDEKGREKARTAACTLRRPDTCEICGKTKPVQGHHDDYTKPLEVRWLCQKCHSRLHAIVRRARRNTVPPHRCGEYVYMRESLLVCTRPDGHEGDHTDETKDISWDTRL